MTSLDVRLNAAVDLEVEHANLLHILEDTRALAEHHSFVQAAKRLGELRRHLERHVEMEEQELLPQAIQEGALAPRHLERLRSEHHRLTLHLTELWNAISQWDELRARQWSTRLEKDLRDHQDLEEQVLHPFLDSLRRLPPKAGCKLCGEEGR